MKRERRDIGPAGEKEWQEFRTSYAAIRLFAFLLEDLNRLAPQYAPDFRKRLNHGIAVGEGYLEDDPASDGPALIPDVAGGEPLMIDLSAARLLEDQLFPDREIEDARDFEQATRGMVVVALYAALASYAAALGVTKPKTALPAAIVDFLAHQVPTVQLDHQTLAQVTEFHETRVLIVHNKSIINERYLRNVLGTPLHAGETRHLTPKDMASCATSVWNAAKALASVTIRGA